MVLLIPLFINFYLGIFAIATVGRINLTERVADLINLGYNTYKELGLCAVVSIKYDSFKVEKEASKDMKMCSFLWTYYRYPPSTSEMNLISRRRIADLEGTEDVSDAVLAQYADPDHLKV